MTKRQLNIKKIWIIISLILLYISAIVGIADSIHCKVFDYAIIIIPLFFGTHAVLTTLLYFIDKELYGEKLTDKEEKTIENNSNKDDKKE